MTTVSETDDAHRVAVADCSERHGSTMTPEQERQILEAPPRGTWALILVTGLAMLGCWLYFFFGVFMSHGPVN